MYEEEIIPGDIVAVRHGTTGRQEGLVVGAYFDNLGRQVIQVQLENQVVRPYWLPHVTHVRRTVSYTRPKQRTIERRIYY